MKEVSKSTNSWQSHERIISLVFFKLTVYIAISAGKCKVDSLNFVVAMCSKIMLSTGVLFCYFSFLSTVSTQWFFHSETAAPCKVTTATVDAVIQIGMYTISLHILLGHFYINIPIFTVFPCALASILTVFTRRFD